MKLEFKKSWNPFSKCYIPQLIISNRNNIKNKIEFLNNYLVEKLKITKETSDYLILSLPKIFNKKVNNVILSLMNYLNNNEDLLLFFCYIDCKWGRGENIYEVGYISNYPKEKIEKNLEEYNVEKKLNKFNYSGKILDRESCGAVNRGFCHRLFKTIEINNNEFLEIKLKPNQTFIRTTILSNFDPISLEMSYDKDELSKMIKGVIEK